jgi:hypothetical protein
MAGARTIIAGNRIQRLLDARDFPWRESQADLIARHFIVDDPWYGRHRIVLVDREPPLFAGLLRPVHFEADPDSDPSMPPLRLTGWLWAGRKGLLQSRAMASLGQAAYALRAALGPPEADDTSNTRGWRWRDGPASVALSCFPPTLNRGSASGSAGRRVSEACRFTILTGYRADCTDEERGWIEAFAPFATLFDGQDRTDIAALAPRQAVLDYVREPFPGCERVRGAIGRSAGGEAVILATDQLYVVPAPEVDHVHVDRMTAGRGPGQAVMSLACRGRFGSRPVRRINAAFAANPDGLNERAARIAEWLGVPCLLGDPYPDG